MNKNHIILYSTLISLAAAIFCGLYFGPAMLSIKWIGVLFLNTLKMLIVPVLLTSVISGIAGLSGGQRLRNTSIIAVLYYATTTGLAVLTGLILVNIISPGTGISVMAAQAPEAAMAKADQGISQIILQMVSPSLLGAAADNQLLPVIVFAILLGTSLLVIGESGRGAVQFFRGLNTALMHIIGWVMYLMPLGLFALVSVRLGEAGGADGLAREAQSLGLYMFTVSAGLAIHFFSLLAILWFFTRRHWFYIVAMGRALVTAFATASSSATLPLTMRCALDADVDKRSVRFVMPLGATLNMDGTALYEAVAALFIAQAYGIHLGLDAQIIVLLTATLAAVGAAGVPQAGLVTMVIVLTAVNLPLEGIGLLAGRGLDAGPVCVPPSMSGATPSARQSSAGICPSRTWPLMSH